MWFGALNLPDFLTLSIDSHLNSFGLFLHSSRSFNWSWLCGWLGGFSRRSWFGSRGLLCLFFGHRSFLFVTCGLSSWLWLSCSLRLSSWRIPCNRCGIGNLPWSALRSSHRCCIRGFTMRSCGCSGHRYLSSILDSSRGLLAWGSHWLLIN